MDWLKLHYERAALIVAVVALLVCSGLIVFYSQSFPSNFTDRNSTKPHNNTIKELPVASLKTAADLADKPSHWESHDGSLFVSRPYVLKNGVLIDPLAGDQDLHPPIKNSWLIKYDLPYWDADVADQDPDGDHFSNLEEFNNGTNPRDDKSIPPYWTKLRLKQFISVPFRLKFGGDSGDGVNFTINTIGSGSDRGGRTQFLPVGAMIDGTPYKLLDYKKKSTTKDDIDVDTSELTIENTVTHQKLVLVANQTANDPTSYAEFLYTLDNSTFKVKKDDDFSIAPEPTRKYKLIDISDKEAQIKDLQSGEEHKIPLAQ